MNSLSKGGTTHPVKGHDTRTNRQTNSRKVRRKRLIEVKKTGTKEEIRIVRELCYETGKAVQKHHEYLTNKNK